MTAADSCRRRYKIGSRSDRLYRFRGSFRIGRYSNRGGKRARESVERIPAVLIDLPALIYVIVAGCNPNAANPRVTFCRVRRTSAGRASCLAGLITVAGRLKARRVQHDERFRVTYV